MIAAPTPGFSLAAQQIAKAMREEQLHLQNSVACRVKSGDELSTVWEECRTPNWDGFNAVPIRQETLRVAYTFLESLPYAFPAPSIGADPEGDITLEWHKSQRRTLSISVTSNGELHYAAFLCPSRCYGTEIFFGGIPAVIFQLIRQVDGR